MKFNLSKKNITALVLSAAISTSTSFSLVKTAHAATLQNDVKVEIDDNHSYKVAVITNKLEENGNHLMGATLQIKNEEGIIFDEWLTDGSEHVSMLPEGKYILHETNAPKGYKISEDQEFTVKITINKINAGVVHDDDPAVCWHYEGVPLYYVESKGQKEEVYCINQGLDEPNNINYSGVVLDEENIKLLAPDADPNMSNSELYHKILDIIYHRSKVLEKFSNLSETEIRYITEYALKNYTSANVDDGGLFRRYKYDPTAKEKFVEDKGNGNALGQLAKHWWYYHNKQTIPDVYAELYEWLISDNDPHPEDMHLYIYSTNELTPEQEKYQNLLGIKWFDPYDKDYIINLTNINKFDEIESINSLPSTGDNSNILGYSLFGLSSVGIIVFQKVKNNKIKKKKIGAY